MNFPTLHSTKQFNSMKHIITFTTFLLIVNTILGQDNSQNIITKKTQSSDNYPTVQKSLTETENQYTPINGLILNTINSNRNTSRGYSVPSISSDNNSSDDGIKTDLRMSAVLHLEKRIIPSNLTPYVQKLEPSK